MSMRAHQHHEGRGDVFAEALLAVEPELVGGVLAVDARLQRVDVAAGAQPLQRRRTRAGLLAAPPGRRAMQVGGQLQRARVEAGGSSRYWMGSTLSGRARPGRNSTLLCAV
jgi:hypothetical protein